MICIMYIYFFRLFPDFKVFETFVPTTLIRVSNFLAQGLRDILLKFKINKWKKRLEDSMNMIRI